MWEQMKKMRCIARLFLRVPNGGIALCAIPPGYAPCSRKDLDRVPNGGIALCAIPPGYAPYPALRRLHIAHRRRADVRADVGANEKEAVRSTAVFASAERGHRAPRDTTGIRPLFTQRFRPSAERGHRAPRDTTGIRPYPALRRLHIAHRRRADAGANEKEAVRSTAVFASAERGHRAPRDTTGIPPYPAMPDRNNINEIRKRSNISYFRNMTYL